MRSLPLHFDLSLPYFNNTKIIMQTLTKWLYNFLRSWEDPALDDLLPLDDFVDIRILPCIAQHGNITF